MAVGVFNNSGAGFAFSGGCLIFPFSILKIKVGKLSFPELPVSEGEADKFKSICAIFDLDYFKIKNSEKVIYTNDIFKILIPCEKW